MPDNATYVDAQHPTVGLEWRKRSNGCEWMNELNSVLKYLSKSHSLSKITEWSMSPLFHTRSYLLLSTDQHWERQGNFKDTALGTRRTLTGTKTLREKLSKFLNELRSLYIHSSLSESLIHPHRLSRPI